MIFQSHAFEDNRSNPGYLDQIILGAPRSYEIAASFQW